MGEQVRAEHRRHEQTEVSEEITTQVGAVATKNAEAEAVKSDADKVLDEIDAVLEANAEEFVSQFIQRGGE